MWRVLNRIGRSIQGEKELWAPKRGFYRTEQQEGCANRLHLRSGSAKMCMKCFCCAIHSWVSTAVLSIVWDFVERNEVVRYSRYITLKYSENKFLHFFISCNPDLSFSWVWLCTNITFCGTVGKYQKVNLTVLQHWIHPILLAPGQQLLALSSRHDIPPFFLYWLLEIFFLQ